MGADGCRVNGGESVAMPQPLIQALPSGMFFADGYRLRLTALDPTTGAVVAGVVVSETTFQVRPVDSGPGDSAPIPQLVPSDGLV